jgi:hypothetical protein
MAHALEIARKPGRQHRRGGAVDAQSDPTAAGAATKALIAQAQRDTEPSLRASGQSPGTPEPQPAPAP